MKISIKLIKSETYINNDHPIKIVVSYVVGGKQKIKRINTGFSSSDKDWNKLSSEPKETHPDYYRFMPWVLETKSKILDLSIDGVTSIDYIQKVLSSDSNVISLNIIDFAKEFKNEKSYKNKGLYGNSIDHFESYLPIAEYKDYTYNNLIGFRNYLINKGLKGATVQRYLNIHRTIYNEYCKRMELDNKLPFKGVFSGLNVKSNRNKKNFIEVKDLKKLSQAKLSGKKEEARDFWLLQFYLGGTDLKDIVMLKKNDIHANRVSFKRSKNESGYYMNNKLFDPAIELINKYKGLDKVYLFDFRTDIKGYEGLRRRIRLRLIDIQKDLKIKLPNGGNLGIKTARHTFANLGKLNFVEPDLLRELMGHERNDIDNFYKDQYPIAIKDKAHLSIVENAWK